MTKEQERLVRRSVREFIRKGGTLRFERSADIPGAWVTTKETNEQMAAYANAAGVVA